MSMISFELPTRGLITECSPGVSNQALGAASLNPAVVPMLLAVTRSQLNPAGSLGPVGGGLEGVTDGEGVGVGDADGLPDGPPDGLEGVG